MLRRQRGGDGRAVAGHCAEEGCRGLSSVFSIEYAHYDSSRPLKDVVDAINRQLTPFLSLYPQAQKGIMFDDIHADIGFDEYRAGVQSLSVQPDTLYAESAFEPCIAQLVERLQAQGFLYEQEAGRSFVTRKDKRYNAESTFLLRYEDKGRQQFSCPALVAASYLYRLGFFEGAVVTPLSGAPIRVAKEGQILSLLPARYIQVESNARILCELVSPGISARIAYFLY